jgi:predicted dehydrogenase
MGLRDSLIRADWLRVMVRAAIVGCGKIADAHASQIRRIKGAEIVAALDSEELMARQFCERFLVKDAFRDLDELLEKAKPDVVHITTPPGSHFPVAKQCLEMGCHVYVEKPFTLYANESRQLIDLAEQQDRKLTVGHDAQFTHVARQLRSQVKKDYLGGKPIHLESTYCYDLGNVVYARAFLGNQGHWLRTLPGKLLHNVISHGVARIAEYIEGDAPEIIASGFISPMLRALGENEIIDELRVMINDSNRLTAYFTFSSQMRPAMNQFRVYGSKNGLFLDETQQILIRLKGEKLKSYGERFVPQIQFSLQYLQNLGRNLRLFLKNDFHFESGKKYLMTAFYECIENKKPVPIPYREIILISDIMEEVFRQLSDRRLIKQLT